MVPCSGQGCYKYIKIQTWNYFLSVNSQNLLSLRLTGNIIINPSDKWDLFGQPVLEFTTHTLWGVLRGRGNASKFFIVVPLDLGASCLWAFWRNPNYFLAASICWLFFMFVLRWTLFHVMESARLQAFITTTSTHTQDSANAAGNSGYRDELFNCIAPVIQPGSPIRSKSLQIVLANGLKNIKGKKTASPAVPNIR